MFLVVRGLLGSFEAATPVRKLGVITTLFGELVVMEVVEVPKAIMGGGLRFFEFQVVEMVFYFFLLAPASVGVVTHAFIYYISRCLYILLSHCTFDLPINFLLKYYLRTCGLYKI